MDKMVRCCLVVWLFGGDWDTTSMDKMVRCCLVGLLFLGNWDKISIDKNMIIINKNNLFACLFAPNGSFCIIFFLFLSIDILYERRAKHMDILISVLGYHVLIDSRRTD